MYLQSKVYNSLLCVSTDDKWKAGSALIIHTLEHPCLLNCIFDRLFIKKQILPYPSRLVLLHIMLFWSVPFLAQASNGLACSVLLSPGCPSKVSLSLPRENACGVIAQQLSLFSNPPDLWVSPKNPTDLGQIRQTFTASPAVLLHSGGKNRKIVIFSSSILVGLWT